MHRQHLSKHCTSFGLLMPPTNWTVSPKVEKQARLSYLQLGSTGTDTLTTGTLHQHTPHPPMPVKGMGCTPCKQGTYLYVTRTQLRRTMLCS